MEAFVGRNITGEICEGQEIGEGGWNDCEFLFGDRECVQVPNQRNDVQNMECYGDMDGKQE